MGLGFNLAQVDEFPLAAIDFTMERGIAHRRMPLEETLLAWLPDAEGLGALSSTEP